MEVKVKLTEPHTRGEEKNEKTKFKTIEKNIVTKSLFTIKILFGSPNKPTSKPLATEARLKKRTGLLEDPQSADCLCHGRKTSGRADWSVILAGSLGSKRIFIVNKEV